MQLTNAEMIDHFSDDLNKQLTAMTNFQIIETIKSFTKENKYLLDDIYIFYTTHETTLEKHYI